MSAALSIALVDDLPLPSRRPTVLAAGLCVLSLVGGIVGWTMWAWIDSAVLAQGYVVVDGRRKTVQHLEGGILRELLVREGDRVQAQVGELEDRLFATRCRIERLQAERDDLRAIVWSDRLRDPPTPAAREVLTGQEELFAARRLTYQSEIGALARQIEQEEQDARATAQQRDAVQRQRSSLERELAGAQRLLAQGWESRTRAEQLERQLAGVEARDAELRGAMARATEGAAAAWLGIDAKRNARLADIGQQLDE